jgi:hypothetical protein
MSAVSRDWTIEQYVVEYSETQGPTRNIISDLSVGAWDDQAIFEDPIQTVHFQALRSVTRTGGANNRGRPRNRRPCHSSPRRQEPLLALRPVQLSLDGFAISRLSTWQPFQSAIEPGLPQCRTAPPVDRRRL